MWNAPALERRSHDLAGHALAKAGDFVQKRWSNFAALVRNF